jgi:RHS repeat-associated protein
VLWILSCSNLYDANTLRMTGWTFQVNSVQETGALTWNPIGSLQKLAITDNFNSGGTQTCSFNSSLVTGTGYDDLNRIIGTSCGSSGSLWNQTFSYDQYDNICKSSSGFVSWCPTYSSSPSNNHISSTGYTYDSNGDMTNDGVNAYTWNAFSKMASVNMSGTGCATSGGCIVYDALGREVEIDNGTTYEEIFYMQAGRVYLNGNSEKWAYWPAPGGGTVADDGDMYYMHKDWLGSARILSVISSSPTVLTDKAYAPYGEVYDVFSSTLQWETMFGGGSTQDVIAGMYDTPNRELQGSQQGRFLSPDPAGSGWNQYAYPTNPNSMVDPTGLEGGGPGTLNCLIVGRVGAHPASVGGCTTGGGAYPYGGGGAGPLSGPGQITNCDTEGCGSGEPGTPGSVLGQGTVGADGGGTATAGVPDVGDITWAIGGLMQDDIDPCLPPSCQVIPGGTDAVSATVSAQFELVPTQTSDVFSLIPMPDSYSTWYAFQPYVPPMAIVIQYHPPVPNAKAVGPKPQPPKPSLVQCFTNPSDAVDQMAENSNQPGADPDFPSQIYINGNRGQRVGNGEGDAEANGWGLLITTAVDFVGCFVNAF